MEPLQKALISGDLHGALDLYEGDDPQGLLHYLSNDNRVIWLCMLAESGQIDDTHAPAVAEAIIHAHGLRHLWPSLRELILWYMPTPLFDGEEAHAAYVAMGDMVTVYRGDYADWEDQPWAPSWTLSLEKAEWFTKRSNGVVRIITVPRDNILAVLFERNEQEVLIEE